MRKSFFVKPKVLFRYVAYALVSVIVTSVCVWFVMRMTVASSEALENVNNFELAQLQKVMTAQFWWIVLILIVIIGLQSLLMFHRMVGPIYAFEKVTRELTEGHLIRNFHLRNKDEFKELAYLMDRMSGTFIENIKKDRDTIAGVSAELDKLAVSPEDRKRISEIKDNLAQVTSYFKVS